VHTVGCACLLFFAYQLTATQKHSTPSSPSIFELDVGACDSRSDTSGGLPHPAETNRRSSEGNVSGAVSLPYVVRSWLRQPLDLDLSE
jgi:hypothetical protein